MIIISRHAEERIQERTKLSVQEVKEIIESQVFKNLGQVKSGEAEYFFLFFSRPDSRCFVAVMSSDKFYLKTVLDPRIHKIPVSLNKRSRKIATEKYKQWNFRRNVSITQVEESPVPALLRVKLFNRVEFSHDLGEVFLSQYGDVKKCICKHLELFWNLADIVSNWLPVGVSQKNIKYELLVKKVRAVAYTPLVCFNHKKLLEHLKVIDSRSH